MHLNDGERMTRRPAMRLAFGGLLALALGLARADEPRFKDVVLSDDEDPDETETHFEAASLARLYLTAEVVGALAGSRIRCDWIQLAPAERTLASQAIVLEPNADHVKFAYAPAAGGRWAKGPHRADLYFEGRRLRSVNFIIQ